MTAFRKLTTTGAVALFAAAAPAVAQMTDWDADADGLLSQDEFTTGFEQRQSFGAWDANADGMLDRDEWFDGTFSSYDADRSDALETPEFDTLMADQRWGYDGWSDTTAGWDVDGDGILLRDEYLAGIGDAQLGFGDWDGDGDDMVSQDEFAASVFDSYDDDGDGSIAEPELADVGDDMGDDGFWDA